MDLRRLAAAPDEPESCRLLLSWLLDADLPTLFQRASSGGFELAYEARGLLPPSFVWEFERKRHPHEDPSLLCRTLDWMRLNAPGAVLEVEFGSGAELLDFASRFEPIHTGTDHASHPDRLRWFVSDQVVVHLMEPSPHDPPWVTPSLFVRGRNRAEVEVAIGGDVADQRWVQLERVMEPRSDRVTLPSGPWRFRGDPPVGPLSAVLGGRSPTEAIEGFVEYWFGIPLPPSTGSDAFPEAYDRLQALDREHHVFVNDMLENQTGQVAFRDTGIRGTRVVRVWCESQGLATAGYRLGDRSDDPEMVMAWDFDGKDGASGGLTLAEFLLRQLMMEAIWQSPLTAATSIEVDQVEAMLSRLDVVFSQHELLPAVGAIGAAIVRVAHVDVTALRSSPKVEVMAAAHTRGAIADGPLADIGGWAWGYESEWSARSPVNNVLTDWDHEEPDIFEGLDPDNLTAEDTQIATDRLIGLLGGTGPIDDAPEWPSGFSGRPDADE